MDLLVLVLHACHPGVASHELSEYANVITHASCPYWTHNDRHKLNIVAWWSLQRECIAQMCVRVDIVESIFGLIRLYYNCVGMIRSWLPLVRHCFLKHSVKLDRIRLYLDSYLYCLLICVSGVMWAVWVISNVSLLHITEQIFVYRLGVALWLYASRPIAVISLARCAGFSIAID